LFKIYISIQYYIFQLVGIEFHSLNSKYYHFFFLNITTFICVQDWWFIRTSPSISSFFLLFPYFSYFYFYFTFFPFFYLPPFSFWFFFYSYSFFSNLDFVLSRCIFRNLPSDLFLFLCFYYFMTTGYRNYTNFSYNWSWLSKVCLSFKDVIGSVMIFTALQCFWSLTIYYPA